MFNEFLQDLRFGIRTLLRNRSFTLTALLALGLGIGASSAVFSVLYGVLLKPLPYVDPDRLVRVYMNNLPERFQKFPLSPGDFLDYRRDNQVFQEFATLTRQDQQLSGDRAERIINMRVSDGFFRVFGFSPMLGRAFTKEEEASGGPTTVAMISHRFWRRHFSSDPNVIGKTITLTDSKFQIVGVMPPNFEAPDFGSELPRGEAVDVWMPLDRLGSPRPQSRAAHFCTTIAKLRPGVTMETAQSELNSIATRLETQYPDDKNWRVQLEPLHRDLVGSARPTLLILAGAVAFVVLIACVNVANLLLARGAAREREMSIRRAVGASRVRLIRQMLTESAALAITGGAIGLFLAYWSVRALVLIGPGKVPRLESIGLDAVSLLVTGAITLLCLLGFGLLPAAAATSNVRQSRPRGAFVIAEVALAFVLLIGAGLLLRSFHTLGRVDPGFNAQNVITMNTTLSWAKLGGARRYVNSYEAFVQTLAKLPGVSAAGMGSKLPWSGGNNNALIGIEGRPRPAGASMHAHYQAVSPDYFRAIGVPLLAGRWATAADHFDAPKIALINKALALKYWPSTEAALGQRLYTLRDANTIDTTRTIVGVVGDVKDSPTEFAAEPAFFEPQLQSPTFGNYIVLRSTLDPIALIPLVRQAAREAGNDLSIQEIRTLEDVVASAVSTERFALQTIGLFAGVALALALIGVYGVTAYSTSRRIKEMAIRSALGARPVDVVRTAMSKSVQLILVGLLMGGIAAAGLTRSLTGLLYQVTAMDPITFILSGVSLGLIAIAACYSPAARAARVDPAEVLRGE